MTSRIIAVLCILSATASFSQVGDPFPELSGETVLDEVISIPNDTRDKYTLVGLAYSKKSEDDLSSWFSPSYNLFVRDKEDAGVFASFTYDVNLYFVPMFTGVKAAAAGTATCRRVHVVLARARRRSGTRHARCRRPSVRR